MVPAGLPENVGVVIVGLVANTTAPVPVTFPVGIPEIAGVTNTGVCSVAVKISGDTLNTSDPVPVSLVTAAARLALVGEAKKVATFAPNPLTPVVMGKPVAFVRVADDGVPSAGVTSVGEVANTTAPLPVVPLLLNDTAPVLSSVI